VIFLGLALLAFGITDLIGGRAQGGEPEKAEPEVAQEPGVLARFRRLIGVVLGSAAAGVVAAFGAYPLLGVAGIVVAALTVLSVWSMLEDDGRPRSSQRARLSLAWVGGVLLATVTVSSLARPIEGPLARWYSALEFGFVGGLPVDRFVLGVGAAVFALATCNRIVLEVLTLTDVQLPATASRMKGGRFLGPMERLLVGAVILAGDPAAAAIVIAAKGLLRFPEINASARNRSEGQDCSGGATPDTDPDDAPLGPDQLTEYFLVGTLSSLLLACALALAVSAAS
jgi:hypothetical protein